MAIGEQCVIQHCDNLQSKTMNTCSNCRAAQRRWSKKGVAAILVRMDTLEKWKGRMVTLAEEKIDIRRHSYKKVLKRFSEIKPVKAPT
jgi:hypothetical protein